MLKNTVKLSNLLAHHNVMHTDQRPTLSQLMVLDTSSGERVDIIEAITAEWKIFGDYLEFDETAINHISQEHKSHPMDCCTEMMREWLKGRGRQPATWATLIDLLKVVEMNKIAQQLEGMLLPLRAEGKEG